MKDRTPAQQEAWAIRWGVGLLCVLTGALLVVMLWSAAEAGQARQKAAVQAEQTLTEVHLIADRVDRQAERLDVQAAEVARNAEAMEAQAAALSEIADRLEQAAAASELSRAQFQQAVRDILAALDSDADPFTRATQSAQIEPEPSEECTPPTARRCREN